MGADWRGFAPPPVVLNEGDPFSPVTFYEKGACVNRMIRDEIGELNWWTLLGYHVNKVSLACAILLSLSFLLFLYFHILYLTVCIALFSMFSLVPTSHSLFRCLLYFSLSPSPSICVSIALSLSRSQSLSIYVSLSLSLSISLHLYGSLYRFLFILSISHSLSCLPHSLQRKFSNPTLFDLLHDAESIQSGISSNWEGWVTQRGFPVISLQHLSLYACCSFVCFHCVFCRWQLDDMTLYSYRPV